MSSSLTEEPLDVLAISSSAFGMYEVPRLHIEGMTSHQIIHHVAKLSCAGGTSSAMVVHLDWLKNPAASVCTRASLPPTTTRFR